MTTGEYKTFHVTCSDSDCRSQMTIVAEKRYTKDSGDVYFCAACGERMVFDGWWVVQRNQSTGITP